jgi:hypothetical protein
MTDARSVWGRITDLFGAAFSAISIWAIIYAVYLYGRIGSNPRRIVEDQKLRKINAFSYAASAPTFGLFVALAFCGLVDFFFGPTSQSGGVAAMPRLSESDLIDGVARNWAHVIWVGSLLNVLSLRFTAHLAATAGVSQGIVSELGVEELKRRYYLSTGSTGYLATFFSNIVLGVYLWAQYEQETLQAAADVFSYLNVVTAALFVAGEFQVAQPGEFVRTIQLFLLPYSPSGEPAMDILQVLWGTFVTFCVMLAVIYVVFVPLAVTADLYFRTANAKNDYQRNIAATSWTFFVIVFARSISLFLSAAALLVVTLGVGIAYSSAKYIRDYSRYARCTLGLVSVREPFMCEARPEATPLPPNLSRPLDDTSPDNLPKPQFHAKPRKKVERLCERYETSKDGCIVIPEAEPDPSRCPRGMRTASDGTCYTPPIPPPPPPRPNPGDDREILSSPPSVVYREPLSYRPFRLIGSREPEFDVLIEPRGNVFRLILTKSSGNTRYDASAEEALKKYRFEAGARSRQFIYKFGVDD